jgi:biotin operon repressor
MTVMRTLRRHKLLALFSANSGVLVSDGEIAARLGIQEKFVRQAVSELCSELPVGVGITRAFKRGYVLRRAVPAVHRKSPELVLRS